ncbi:hypothetical protein FF011L_29960 [Roseimaritima multifibrata]|uniref:Uncharacterized protein n=1 Tax=Roseimaritima multifibrata TaxID=1930274 RepID=A0A517MHG2_9BACT|nr:hypothetical protein FF011L_29960 [Roseimaritima multifibrata]
MVMCCVSFDDGTWIFWHDDSPVLVTFPALEPEQYESGTVHEIDDLLDAPERLYELPEKRMDAVRERYVRIVLGFSEF